MDRFVSVTVWLGVAAFYGLIFVIIERGTAR